MYIRDQRHMVFFMLSYPRCKNGFFSLPWFVFIACFLMHLGLMLQPNKNLIVKSSNDSFIINNTK